jgi:hypothetical protein
MGLYRKKPVIIEAREFDLDTATEIAFWCGGKFDYRVKPSDPTDVYYFIDIPTLEGVTRADLGDFVIKGVKGEFYACKPDIFWLTYEDMESKSRTNLDLDFLHDGFYHDS